MKGLKELEFVIISLSIWFLKSIEKKRDTYYYYYRIDSPEKMKNMVPQWYQSIKDDATFKKLYLYTFGFAKTTGQKSMDVDVSQYYFNGNYIYLILCYCQFKWMLFIGRYGTLATLVRYNLIPSRAFIHWIP